MSGKIDVLVVGAGPTGLMMAIELKRHGVNCRIIDKNDSPSVRSKALVVQVRSVEIFDDIGIAAKAIAQSQKIIAANIFADNRTHIKVRLEQALEVESPYPHPLILEQNKTEQILEEHLQSLGLEVERRTELVDFSQDQNGVYAQLQCSDQKEEKVTCDWIVGCDGAHSIVRRKLEIPFDGCKYEDTFILADVDVDWDRSHEELTAFVSQQGFLAMLPMYSDKHYRLISVRKGYDGKGQDPTLEEIQNIAQDLVPIPIKISNPRWTSNFIIHCRGVSQYRQGRAFVAGDAAHIHSPAGGQGMNTGLQDAYNLAWKLALVVKGKANPVLLDSYHEERHPIGEFLLRNTDRGFRAMVKSGLLIRLIRGFIVPLAVKLHFVRRRIAKIVSQLGIHYKSSSIVAEYSSGPKGKVKFAKGPKAGERAPDASLKNSNEEEITLFSLLRGPHHTLFLYTGLQPTKESIEFLATICQDLEQKYADGFKIYLIASKKSLELESWQGLLCYDHNNSFQQRYALSFAALYLIRPDGYIGFRSQPAKVSALTNYLNKIFI